LGDIDLLGEVSGVGNYQNLAANAVEMQICGISVRVISLDDLISAKRAAGRTKDLLVLPELEALREALSKAD
jgi:predicted nucleotidyltransferase